jgi:hypothetical protein
MMIGWNERQNLVYKKTIITINYVLLSVNGLICWKDNIGDGNSVTKCHQAL